MSRAASLFWTSVFVVLVPATVGIYLPWVIVGGRLAPPFFGLEALRWLGVGLMVAGGSVLLDAAARFAWQGLGTPAPIAPPRRLVVSGAYRYVRNPMYVAVLALVLGEALLAGSGRLLAYAAALFVGFHLFVLFYEEPTLSRKFPQDYPAFVAAVPRWLPRFRPWRSG